MIKSPTKKTSFGEWLTFWFETYKKPVLAWRSLRNIEQVIRIHTPEWLKAIPVSKLTIFDIDRALSEKKINRTYIYIRQVWHAALFKACRAGLIDKNPVDLCERVRYNKKRSKALTIAEQRDFIERLEGKRIRWLMLFYLHTGVRRTEALTLEWRDVHEADSVILIRGTKTAESLRYILLTDDIKAILEGQRKQIEKEVGTKYESKNKELVFDYSPNYISQAFRKVCPEHHLHELRHTFITRCCESGINVNVCQQLVGHKSADMTVNVYTHVLDDFKKREAAKFTLFPHD